MRGVLQSRFCTLFVKNLEKYLQSSSLFFKVAGCRPAILLKMNSFTGIPKSVVLLHCTTAIL